MNEHKLPEAIEKRIEYLREKCEENSVHMSRGSEAWFRSFVKNNPEYCMNGLVVRARDDGQLRAVWKDTANGDFVGLEFLETGMISLDCYKDRSSNTQRLHRSVVCGLDTPEGTVKLIKALHLDSLVVREMDIHYDYDELSPPLVIF